MTSAERLYAHEQSAQIAERCGSPGYLHGGLDNTGTMFLSRWERNAVPENTPEFKAEFDTVLDMFRLDERYDYALKNRVAMIAFCLAHPEARLETGQEYTFRTDTSGYAYLIRCVSNGEDHHVYVYPYHQNRLDRHIKQAEKGTRVNATRYVDDCHFEVVTDYDSYAFAHTSLYLAPSWFF